MRLIPGMAAALMLAAPAIAFAQSAPSQAMGYRGSFNTYTYGNHPIGRGSHAYDDLSGNNGAVYSGGGGTENGGTTAPAGNNGGGNNSGNGG